MFRLNILILLYTGFLYHIKIVFSNTLNLQTMDNSGFYTIKFYENGIIKTMVFSTPDKPITKVRQGRKSIWDSLPGESVKCLTYYQFKGSNRKLMSIEINNPVKNDIYYLHTVSCNYLYISKEEFENEFLELANIAKRIHEKHSKSLLKPPIPELKNPSEHKADTDDTEKPKKPKKPKKRKAGSNKITEQKKKIRTKEPKVEPQPQHQQLLPEVVQVEVESDDEETDTASEPSTEDESEELTEEQKEQKKQLIMEKINFVVSSDSDSEVDTNEQEKSFDPSIEPQPQPQQLLPEVVQVEMESDDESTDTASESEDDLLNDLLVEEEVEKLLERELKDIGFSQAEIDSLFEETTEDLTEGDSSKD